MSTASSFMDERGLPLPPGTIVQGSPTVTDLRQLPKPDEPIIVEKEQLQPVSQQQPFVCPNCRHTYTPEKELIVNREDKLNFVQSTLAGKPFTKSYSLFAGQLLVKLRSLSTQQADLVIAQLTKDKPTDAETLWRLYWEYRFCFAWYDQLDTVDVNSNLTELLNSVKSATYWQQESLWNLAISTYKQFQQLVDYLEQKAVDVNFW